MNVKTITALALAAGLTLLLLSPPAKADDPYAEYNRQRAYHLFLTSPSPYRTYSGVTPGYVRRYSTPYAYGEDWQAPTYRHERITPYGYERYVAPPARGGYVVPRPVVIVPPYCQEVAGLPRPSFVVIESRGGERRGVSPPVGHALPAG